MIASKSQSQATPPGKAAARSLRAGNWRRPLSFTTCIGNLKKVWGHCARFRLLAPVGGIPAINRCASPSSELPRSRVLARSCPCPRTVRGVTAGIESRRNPRSARS